MDLSTLLSVFVQAGSFIAAFAAISAGILMTQVSRKFGSGILASGFKSISVGVFFIAFGIIIDSVNSYIQINSNIISAVFLITKEIFFIIGTFIIVIGTKNTADKMQTLTK